MTWTTETIPATGTDIAGESIGSKLYQGVKPVWGGSGVANYVDETTPLPVVLVSAGATTNIFRYLDTAGDGSGTKNAVGDYSGGEEEFYIAPAADEVMLLYRMLVLIEDGSAISSEKYGGLTALSTGIEVKIIRGASTLVNDLTDGIVIQSNADWARNCYDATPDETGSGNNLYKVRWTFANSGKPIRLDGALGDRLVVFLNDDLSGLVSHYFKVDGVYE